LIGHQTFELGDIRLQSGEILPRAALAYITLGTLNEAGDNAIVMPTYYTGRHFNYTSIIGPGWALDPERYYIVIPNMFGNGLSTSPSNRRAGATNGAFPRISLYDNVLQQGRLVFEHLRVSRVALACGWSVGGMQAYQWATVFPSQVKRLLPFCAAARTSNYNAVFLDALKATMQADSNWQDDHCVGVPERGLRAFARVYVGWAYSEAFFRDGLYQELGFPTIEALFEDWENDHLRFDARDLVSMLDTWRFANIGAIDKYGGNTELALKSIQARTLLVPCSTDRYFSVGDNQREARWIPNCEVRVLNSPFGHCALSPGKVARDLQFLNRCLEDLLSC
jgi:homoserine O-acetyltransferase